MFLRLFIAVAVPPEVRAEVGRAQSRLQRVAPRGAIRWTRPDQFHLTLKFLGDVPEEQVAELEKNAAAACAPFPPLTLTAQGIGFFPHERKPRVLWVGADDESRQMAELYRKLDESLRWLSPAQKPERFHAHITLGRFKPGRHGSAEPLLKRIAMLRDHVFGRWQAGAVELVRSELNATGAIHTPIAVFPLNGPPAHS